MGVKNNYWKRYISKEERFADLINVFVGKAVVTEQNLETLDPEGFIKTNAGERKKLLIHDVIKRGIISGRYCILGIENQENINYKMIFRNIGYTLECYERQLEDLGSYHKEKKDLKGDEYISGIKQDDVITPVIIIVVYFGEKAWDGAIDLHNAIDVEEYPEEIKQLIPDHHINLLEVNRFPHMERFQTDIFYVFGFLQRRSDKVELYKFIEENEEAFSNMQEDAFDVICAYGNAEIISKLKDKCKTEGGGYNMCLALDEMRKEECQLGIKEGEIRGEKRGEKRGEDTFARLVLKLMQEGKNEEILKAAQNTEYRRKLYRRYKIYGVD